MRLSTYVYIMFFVAVVLNIAGIKSGSVTALEYLYNVGQGGAPLELGNILTLLGLVALTENSLIGFISTLAAGVVATRLAGFSAIYIIPMVFLFAILNFMVFPIGLILSPDSGIPFVIQLPIIAFFNILGVLAVINFVRGQA